jgi:hypothetical protein
MINNANQYTGSHFTPLNDSGENCERTCAVLRIYSGKTKPIEVTRLLGIEPTSYVAEGEPKPIRDTGRVRIGQVNGWFLSSESKVESKDLRRHLDWLLETLISHLDALQALQMREGIRMNVNCIWWSRYGGGGPVLWPQQMSGLALLNLECSFDFQFYGQDVSTSDERETGTGGTL